MTRIMPTPTATTAKKSGGYEGKEAPRRLCESYWVTELLYIRDSPDSDEDKARKLKRTKTAISTIRRLSKRNNGNIYYRLINGFERTMKEAEKKI